MDVGEEVLHGLQMWMEEGEVLLLGVGEKGGIQQQQHQQEQMVVEEVVGEGDMIVLIQEKEVME